MTPATKTRAPAARRKRTKATPKPGALEGLKVLDASDLPRWKSALERGGESGFGYYFPFVLAHQRPGHTSILIAEDAGCLCVFIRRERKRGSHLDLYLNPIPMDVGVMQRCLDRANEFNGDRSARIRRIDGNDAALVARIPGLEIRERRKQYVFAPAEFGDLAGGRYRTLRSQLIKARLIQDLELVPWSPHYAEPCRALLQQWAERHRRVTGKSGGAGISRRALAAASGLPAPDLTGQVVLIGGRVAGYCLGGELRPGLGCFLDAKSDLEVAGLGYFLRYSFLMRLGQFPLINDGSDARQAGLRQVKGSLRPVAMHSEFQASQVRS